jgi:DeoR/GlpR family transcriptional regulator of sugar metabolism
MSSYGLKERFASKAALQRAVDERGAENILAFDVSAFDNKGTVTLASLADTKESICGPDVYRERTWFGQVKIAKKSGKTKIV